MAERSDDTAAAIRRLARELADLLSQVETPESNLALDAAAGGLLVEVADGFALLVEVAASKGRLD